MVPRLPMHVKVRRAIKERVYDTIRPLFVENVDRNEDYNCEYCGEPVLRRYLYCSDKCCDTAEAALCAPRKSEATS